MNTEQPSSKNEQSCEIQIEKPNIHDQTLFQSWLDRYITSPSKSFRDLTHKDGSIASEKQKIEATKLQYSEHVRNFLENDAPEEFIQDFLISTVKEICRDEKEKNK